MAVKSLKLCYIDLVSDFSRLVFHNSWNDGALDAAAAVAVAVFTHRNDGYASSMLSGDLWQQTPSVTDEMESGGND